MLKILFLITLFLIVGFLLGTVNFKRLLGVFASFVVICGVLLEIVVFRYDLSVPFGVTIVGTFVAAMLGFWLAIVLGPTTLKQVQPAPDYVRKGRVAGVQAPRETSQ